VDANEVNVETAEHDIIDAQLLRSFDLCSRLKSAAFGLLKAFLEGPGARKRAKECLEFVR